MKKKKNGQNGEKGWAAVGNHKTMLTTEKKSLRNQ